ncbi:MAG TPA: nucleotidyl transferase AbiEii/AbiGii toxin family protein [Gammaproteobacteria bacterium]|nr:nucleotidyl transferase AbiEii/AbiGii toxin family protein [Gammaproteobacteria bacterium]
MESRTRTASITEIAKLSARDRQLISSYRGREANVHPEPDKLAALIDTVRALEEAAVPYALIGGLAVGIHAAVPRATVDIDLAAHLGAGRDAAVQALERAGLEKTGEFRHSVNFRHATGEPVQLAFDPDFDAMIERAERFDVAGTTVVIVRKEDLIAMKRRAAGDPARRKSKRLRDQADVELLLGDVPGPDEGW